MKNIIQKLSLFMFLLKTEHTDAAELHSKFLFQRNIPYFSSILIRRTTVNTQRRYSHQTVNLTKPRDKDFFNQETTTLVSPLVRNQDWFKKNSSIVQVPVYVGSNADITSFNAPLNILKIITDDYVAIDVEATGGSLLNKNTLLSNKITELSCVNVSDMKITGERFHSLINPCREVTPVVQKITGYTWQFLKGYPLFEDIVDGFLKYIKGKIIVVHDASLDIPLLNNEIKACGRSVNLYDHNLIIDTLMFANSFYPCKKKNLSKLCHSYGIDTSQRKTHSAFLDADLLARLFCAINRQGDFIYTSKEHSLKSMSMKDFRQLDFVPEYLKNSIEKCFSTKCRFKKKLYHPRFMANYPAILCPFTYENDVLTHVEVSYLLSEEQETIIKEATGKDFSKNFRYGPQYYK
jgi:DNA polymerase-3 subunit epsilon